MGRHLVLGSASELASLPPNLQGVWAEGTKPPWACDLHLNVNLQMAYWPAGPTGLYPEAAAPLAGFLLRLAQSGRRVARLYYGAAERGAWVAHGFTDAWASAAPLGPPAWALCVVCGAWAVLTLTLAPTLTSTLTLTLTLTRRVGRTLAVGGLRVHARGSYP